MAAPLDQRVQALLSDPQGASRQLGTLVGTGDNALRILHETSESSQRLRQHNATLLPLLANLKTSSKAGRWWRWFTGVELEREITFDAVCAQIETSAESGIDETDTLAQLVDNLRDEHKALGADLAALELDMQAGKVLLGTGDDAAKFSAAVGPDGLDRFARKLANLSAMLTALQLTRAQYLVAMQHAKEMLDRFDEIKTLLVPLWYQRMGFELFSHRVKSSVAYADPLKPV